jgi:hypothetical protein
MSIVFFLQAQKAALYYSPQRMWLKTRPKETWLLLEYDNHFF